MPSCDIVLPCYNPIAGWDTVVIQSVEELKTAYPDTQFNLILVNDGSSQSLDLGIARISAAIAPFQYIHNTTNGGKGIALRTGIQQSQAEYIIYTDIDFPYTTDSFKKIYNELISNVVDAAIGVKDADYYQHVPKIRVFISRLLRFLIGFLLRLSITDTQCGLKGFQRHLKPLFLQTTINRYLFDLEFIYILERTPNVRMAAIPISLKENIVFTKPRISLLAMEAFNFVKIMIKRWY